MVVADYAVLTQHIAAERPLGKKAKEPMTCAMCILSYYPKKVSKLQASFSSDESFIYAKEKEIAQINPTHPVAK